MLPTRPAHRIWTPADHAVISAHAASRRSLADAARALGPGVTRNMVLRQAHKIGARFQGAQTYGGGCTPEQARQGWATRRARQSLTPQSPAR